MADFWKDLFPTIGGIVGSIGNLFGTGMANAQNAQNIERQNQLNVEQWMRENNYNLPIAQVQRLRAAGLSPSLMYENGVGGLTAAASPEMQAAHANPLQVDPLTFAQIENIRADTAQKRATAKLTHEQEISQNLRNFFTSFQKDFLSANKESIEQNARMSVTNGFMKSTEEYFKSAYSAAILASFFELDESSFVTIDGQSVHDYSVGGLHYSEDLHKKFRELGLANYEQTMLERELYRSYQAAQLKINKASGEEAKMDEVLPRMINDAPSWLRPILIIAYRWLVDGKSPSFMYAPKKSFDNSSSSSVHEHTAPTIINN